MSEDSICEQVLDFWFQQLGSRDWFRKDSELDARIAREFGDLHRRAGACELYAWRGHSRGRLAEVLVLDQFSRNIYRDSALAFAWDPLALALAQEGVDRGLDRELPPAQRV